MPDILKIIADNPALFDAVKNAVLEEFKLVDGVEDSGRSDEQLGQIFRARLTGLQKVEEAFKKIAKHGSMGDRASKRVNGAR